MTAIERYHIYCDESCTQHRYTIIGGIFCHTTVARKIRDDLEMVIANHGGTSELKWSKVNKMNLPLYKAVVDKFFDLRRGEHIHFRALVIDNSKMDHDQFNDGDKELGFSKMFFSFLYQFSRLYRSNNAYYVYLDDRTTKHRPEDLRVMLNAKCQREAPREIDPFRVCQFQKSHQVRCIQVADILIGAIGYATNRMDLKHAAAPYKKELADYVRQKAELYSLARPTRSATSGFDIWHFDFTKARAKVIPRA